MGKNVKKKTDVVNLITVHKLYWLISVVVVNDYADYGTFVRIKGLHTLKRQQMTFQKHTDSPSSRLAGSSISVKI